MEIKDIYELGKNSEIKAVNNGQTVSVLIYTRGKEFAERFKGSGNVSMPKPQYYQLAKIKKITDENQIQACCYAKAVYDEIHRQASKNGPVYAVTVARNYTRKLKTQPGLLLLSGQEQKDKTTELILINAKKFAQLETDKQNEIMYSITHEDQHQS